MKQWHVRSSAQCPRCQEPNETKQHIFQCQAEETKKQWEEALQGLDDWMQAHNTNPDIRNKLIQGLKQWQTGTNSTAEFCTTAAQEQSLLGWELMLEGAILRQWHKAQATYWKTFKFAKIEQTMDNSTY